MRVARLDSAILRNLHLISCSHSAFEAAANTEPPPKARSQRGEDVKGIPRPKPRFRSISDGIYEVKRTVTICAACREPIPRMSAASRARSSTDRMPDHYKPAHQSHWIGLRCAHRDHRADAKDRRFSTRGQTSRRGKPASLTVINHSSLSVRKVVKMGSLGEPIVLDAASCSSSSITSSS
jgi:hypothetical protein